MESVHPPRDEPLRSPGLAHAKPRGPGSQGRKLLWWYACALALAVLLPSVKFGQPLWHLSHRETLSSLTVLGAFLASAAVPGIALLRGVALSRAVIVITTLAVFSLVFCGLLLTGAAASKTVLLGFFALALVLPPVSFGPEGLGPRAIHLSAALIVVMLLVSDYVAHKARPQPKAAREESTLHTAFYNLRLSSFVGQIPAPLVRGGGITSLGEDFVLGTGDGHLYLFDLAKDSSALSIRDLPYRVPVNGEKFAADVGLSYSEPLGSFLDTGQGEQVQTWRFRVGDVLAREHGDHVELFASHHYWKSDERCFVVRVSMLSGTREQLTHGAQLSWRTLYETHPCVPVEGTDRKRGGNPFVGMEMGGRLAFVDDQHLMLTLGDHGFAGLDTRQSFAQDPSVSYGKIQLIALDGSAPHVFSSGHRNPQGLYIDPAGTIWETEHGPQGGDELNRIVANANYGWPLVTYGTNYGSLIWPLSHTQGDHAGYEMPVYAWLPSIGVSNLIGVERNLFPVWHGDLLVSSLASRSLWRMRMHDGHVILTEQIETPRRIRDVLEAPDGRILLWTDDATLDVLEPATGTDRELAFETLCSGCHKTEHDGSHGLGPDLWGVVGRPIAAAEGYTEYSAALRQHSGRWTEAELDEFLTAPQAYSPGTTMTFPGISDPATRTAVISHLESLH
jgi:cytochrome c2